MQMAACHAGVVRKQSKKTAQRSRNFCFTAQDASDVAQAYCLSLVEESTFGVKAAKYVCFGIEKAPTTDHMHLQGVIIFKTLQTMDAVCKLLDQVRGHVEIMQGKPE